MFDNGFTPIQSVPLEQIDPEDRTLSVSPFPVRSEPLICSVQRAGILTPLVLQRNSSGALRIVQGFRRFLAACVCGFNTIPAAIHPAGSERDLFLKAVWENIGSRSITDLEKGEILYKLRRHFEIPSLLLIDEFLPPLGLKADRYHLDLFLAVARLPQTLKTAVHHGLDLKTALNVSRWAPNEQLFFCRLVTDFQPSLSRQREFFQLADELRAREKLEVASVWEKSGAAQVARRQDLPPATRFAQILESLRKQRFPVLSESEERYQNLKQSLKLPPQIQIQVPPYFEGNQISISLQVNSPQQLIAFCEKLRRTGTRPELAEIFELL